MKALLRITKMLHPGKPTPIERDSVTQTHKFRRAKKDLKESMKEFAQAIQERKEDRQWTKTIKR